MNKPDISILYLVHDLRDNASWGAYETVNDAKEDIRNQVKNYNRTINEFEVVREIIIDDVVWSAKDEA